MTENTIARIEGAKKKLDSLNKKMERIMAAKATGWTKNPYLYGEDDIRRTQKDITEAENRLAFWEGKGKDEDAKAASRNVKPILEFLDGWKAKVTKYYTMGFNTYYSESDNLRKTYKELSNKTYGTDEYIKANKEYEDARTAHYQKCHGYTEKKMVKSRWNNKMEERDVKVRDGELEYVMPYVSGNRFNEALAKLERDLTAEYNSKYDNIVERASYYCGAIEDASELRVGAKGELDGIVRGNKGACRIETIGAGGYNIQCFHFRVLVHEMKEVKNMNAKKTAKTETKIDWKQYSDEQLIQMCNNLNIGIDHLINIEDKKVRRMRLVMAVKKFGMVLGEIAPAAFKS